MKRHEFNSMSVDELWALRSEISSVLASRITAEKANLKSGCGSSSQTINLAPAPGVNGGLIRRCCRSIEIPPNPQRLGRVVGSSHAG